MILHANIMGQGQPLVILHGFMGMSDNWKTLGKKFADEGYEVHLVDQRNHGRSFHDELFNYEVMVEDLLNYCLEHDLSNLILLGHSMGGKIAMLFSVTHPELVSKLIVVDIAPRFYPRHHDILFEGLSALDFEHLTSRREADEVLSNYVENPDIRQFLLKNLYWIEKGRLALRMNLEILMENVDEVGESLPSYLIYHGDTLFIKGERSEYITVEDEASIKRQFPHAHIQCIKGAGHWLHAENPNTFYQAVVEFLNQ